MLSFSRCSKLDQWTVRFCLQSDAALWQSQVARSLLRDHSRQRTRHAASLSCYAALSVRQTAPLGCRTWPLSQTFRREDKSYGSWFSDFQRLMHIQSVNYVRDPKRPNGHDPGLAGEWTQTVISRDAAACQMSCFIIKRASVILYSDNTIYL